VSDAATPGTYGVIVELSDDDGASVAVPVAFRGAPCGDERSTVSPELWPPRVAAAGTAYAWNMTIDDIDLAGSPCSWCYVSSFFPISFPPASLACSASSVVCSDCAMCVSEATSCFDQVVMSRRIDVRPGTRTGPAWLKFELRFTYSGTESELPMCGDKQWACHFEALEI
jgi:hypothetical protein